MMQVPVDDGRRGNRLARLAVHEFVFEFVLSARVASCASETPCLPERASSAIWICFGLALSVMRSSQAPWVRTDRIRRD